MIALGLANVSAEVDPELAVQVVVRMAGGLGFRAFRDEGRLQG